MTDIAELLLQAAAKLLSGKPTETMGRRAISTAYYAVFHALAQACAAQMLGAGAETNSLEYERIYRALDHGSLKAAFRSVPLKEATSIQSIGNRVVELQSERVRADYMPHKRKMYSRRECDDLLHSARFAIEAIRALTPAEKQTLAVHLLFKNRT